MTPLEEFETFVVSSEFDFFVLFEGLEISGDISLDGVIDDQIDRAERVDLVGVTTKTHHSVSHSGEVDDGGHTGEVLKNDTGGLEGNFDLLGGVLLPGQNLLNISLLDVEFIAVSDGTF